MTINAYGVEVELNEEYDFDGWLWEDYTPTELIAEISKGAAKAVLHQIGQDAHLALYSEEAGCSVRVSLGGDTGWMSMSFADIIADWITQEGPDEDARAPLIAELEAALARIKALS